MRTGQTIKMMATGASIRGRGVRSSAALGSGGLRALEAGEVGYFTASIKNVKDTRVGDTVTDAANPTAEALPGYRPVQPMVYCGIYTEDGSKYPDLRDALEKLQLNDASLSLNPNPPLRWALGSGAAFWACSTWRSSRSGWSGNSTWTWSPPCPPSSTTSTRPMAPWSRWITPTTIPIPRHHCRAEEPYAKVNIISPQRLCGQHHAHVSGPPGRV